MIEGNRQYLRIDGGYFHRNILYLRILHVLDIGIESSAGLFFSQQCLAKVIDVHANALFSSFQEVGEQCVFFTRNNGATAVVAHPADHFGDRKRRKVFSKAQEHLN